MKCQALTKQGMPCRCLAKFVIGHIRTFDVRLCSRHYDMISAGQVVTYVDANKHVKSIDGGKK